MTDRVTLSVLVADTIRDRLGLSLPPALDVPAHGDTEDERVGVLRRGWAEAQAAGLVVGNDPDPFVQDAFRALDRPELQVSVVVAEATEESAEVVIAADGEFCVLARTRDGNLELEPVHRSSIARIAVGLLPEVKAGAGLSVTLPSESVEAATRAAGGDQDTLRAELGHVGLRAADAEFLATVLVASRQRAVQFGARGFDSLSGRTTWSPVTVDVIDTEAGRYFAQHRRGPDGRRWFILAPTDRRRLVERVAELLRQVRPATR